MKRCLRCDQSKELYFFSKNPRTIDGRNKTCKSCVEESRKRTKELVDGDGYYKEIQDERTI